jgi:hypothetical protein
VSLLVVETLISRVMWFGCAVDDAVTAEMDLISIAACCVFGPSILHRRKNGSSVTSFLDRGATVYLEWWQTRLPLERLEGSHCRN